MVRQGRVAVNGKVRADLPILIDPERDRVSVDDEPIRLAHGGKDAGPRLYFILNKPTGVYTTNVAQGAQRLAIDLLPPNLPGRVYPVGRLDADSRGLLLMTNDGELTNRLTHPRYGVAKTYRAVVDGYVNPAQLEELEKGIWLADREGKGFKTGRSRIKVVHRERTKSVLEITIREGRNRQVRRMLARIGHKVKDLMRIKMGPLTLDKLPPGQFRPLTKREIRQLQELGEGKPLAEKKRTYGRVDKPARKPPADHAKQDEIPEGGVEDEHSLAED